MRQVSHLSTIVAGMVVALTSIVSGQTTPASGSNDSVQKSLSNMQKEMENLRKENQAMKGQIDDLRAKTDADWLTEARANEIRGLVQDVLADADTRASLLQSGMTAGWSDHFFLASPDGRFELILEGQLQFRFVYNYHDQPDNNIYGFENTRTRLTFRGHVFSQDLEYLVRGDFNRAGGTETLLDAWVRYNMNDEWSVQFGQFKLPFSRETLLSETSQQAIETSLVNLTTTLGRSQGIEGIWSPGSSRIYAMLSDGASTGQGLPPVVMGPPQQNTTALSSANEYAVTARYEQLLAGTWSQMEQLTSPPGDEFGLMVGLAGTWQRGQSTGQPFQQREIVWFGVTADVSAEFGGANLYGAVTYLYIDSPLNVIGCLNVFGVVVQGGVYVAPKWELYGRGEFGSMEFRGSGTFHVPEMWVVTTGVNYYIDGQDVKWSADVGFGLTQIGTSPVGFANDLAGWRFENPGADPQIVIRTQFQLLF